MSQGRARVADTYRSVETPEGVELGLRVAGPVARAGAWAIDFGIRIVCYVAAGVGLGFLGEAGLGLFLLVLFVGEWLYPVLFEVLRRGMTPGKKAMGIQVVQEDGTPMTWGISLIRSLMLFVDFMPFGYALGLLSMAAHRDFKRLGDMVAGSVVIYRDTRSPETSVPRTAGIEAPPVPLSLPEQRAVIGFAERAQTWTPSRQRELANLVVGLTDARGREACDKLLRMANWLLGRR